MARFTAHASSVVAAWLVLSGSAAAAPLVAAASPQQHALTVRVANRQVVARGCQGPKPCGSADAVRIDIPAGADPSRTKREVIQLAGDRRVVLVTSPARTEPGRWVLLLAGALQTEPAHPRVLLKGFVDRPSGSLPGEHQRWVLLRERERDGERVLVGKRFDNAAICGRPTTMAVREIDAATLSWRPAPTRALSTQARAAALPLVATRLPARMDMARPQLLHARLASSAVGHRADGLTDRKLDSGWVENRTAGGTGEFAVMSSAAEVPITGFEIAIRPETTEPPAGAAPKRFFLATDTELFEVTMPEDAWLQPAGVSYGVSLPHPVKSDCVAVVLDEAYLHDDAAAVTIAEIRAQTVHDAEGGDFAALAARLDSRGEDSDIARALLLRSGPRAAQAAIAAYRKLSPAGRRRALDVIDAGGCKLTARFYVDRLVGEGAGKGFDPDLDPLARRARRQLSSCRGAASQALDTFIRDEPTGERQVWAAHALAELAPAASVGVIAGVLNASDPAIRRGLRGALAAAATHARGRRALADELGPARFAGRSLVVRIDLLRSLGEHIGEVPAAKAALAGLVGANASFRTRYLLLGPAALLAAAGDAPALLFVKRSLHHDRDPHIRARAAAASAGMTALLPDLNAVLADRQPRVRQAGLDAAAVMTGPVPPPLRRRAVSLLQRDPWTFVRISAARALGAMGSDEQVVHALIEALGDDSPLVRRAALRAIAAGRLRSAGTQVEAIANNARQPAQVRTAALTTLGALCYADAAPLLYKLALRAGFPELGYDQPLGLAALAALGEIKPADLAQRLAPLLGNDRRVSHTIHAIAREVLARPGSCAGERAKR